LAEDAVKILSVVGARPQFVKLAPVDHALVDAGHRHIIIHTGQHYDPELSGDIFDDLKIPAPDINLGVRAASHGAQTGQMLERLEFHLMGIRPDWVITYGDTNTTLAGALAAVKLRIPAAHIEAGLRSFNRDMPEEHNRIAADHVADLLLAPTRTAMRNLAAERLADWSVLVGDVMADVLYAHRGLGRPDDMPGSPYLVATIHRPGNTDTDRLPTIVNRLSSLPFPVILPAHPRLAAQCANRSLAFGPTVRMIPPLPYTQMIAAVTHSAGVVTDSGGLQKEAYLLGKLCTTLRGDTEWPETLTNGWNVLVGDNLTQLAEFVTRPEPAAATLVDPFGRGDAALKVVEAIEQRTAVN
jgi:UDP-N-acetylglucosamine 2-epimerase (non-hydrolysing)